ncbi:hypothetical protein INT48_000127 [Thamnidium elegans]|uniref:Uncharacterized protein n=1 Tax=Thamnidium elegans TaxID=101142 RepID=A0A8H7SVA0_9FUNG|nr:hypothetical protein INT48_000127 [Thamnidium elegans]
MNDSSFFFFFFFLSLSLQNYKRLTTATTLLNRFSLRRPATTRQQPVVAVEAPATAESPAVTSEDASDQQQPTVNGDNNNLPYDIQSQWVVFDLFRDRYTRLETTPNGAHSWADKCLNISKTTPSQQSGPFVAFGLFLTQSNNITDLVNWSIPKKKYQHLLTLASQQNSSQAIQTSIQNAQAQQLELKRKFDELDDMALTSTFTTVPSTTSSEASPSPSYNVASSTLYQKRLYNFSSYADDIYMNGFLVVLPY